MLLFAFVRYTDQTLIDTIDRLRSYTDLIDLGMADLISTNDSTPEEKSKRKEQSGFLRRYGYNVADRLDDVLIDFVCDVPQVLRTPA